MIEDKIAEFVTNVVNSTCYWTPMKSLLFYNTYKEYWDILHFKGITKNTEYFKCEFDIKDPDLFIKIKRRILNGS